MAKRANFAANDEESRSGESGGETCYVSGKSRFSLCNVIVHTFFLDRLQKKEEKRNEEREREIWPCAKQKNQSTKGGHREREREKAKTVMSDFLA